MTLIGATSFFPSKPLGCYGDGGALFTNDDRLATIMREIRVHGQDRRYHHPRLGLTGRLDSIQAAVLLAKMEIFPRRGGGAASAGRALCRTDRCEVRHGRQRQGARADDRALQYLRLRAVHGRSRTARDRRDAHEDRSACRRRCITRWRCTCSRCSSTSGYNEGDFPLSEAAARRVLSLPMHPYLTDEQQVQVVDALAQAVA